MRYNSKSNIGIRNANLMGIYVDLKGNLIYSNGRISKSKPDHQGYFMFNVYIDGIQHKCQVHRLQAFQKYGNKLFDENTYVRHLNGDSLDNSFENISIGTQSENMMDKSQVVRQKQAEHAASYKRKFSYEDIRSIRSKKRNGYTLRELANEYNSSKGHISDIIHRKIYKNVV